ncbi:uncharacterized protein LOC119978458 [Scyliorhinus canicula]|uniref:uncharacterized protein LOC119978458 n=1 Tax=Scyliorhinus canicula TaxID=7830 RepID=UPI0018F61453|nr:uncharacterized protein LOC119978458 [Scyliorhinus canicula]
MRILILLICSLPVSGALWAKPTVTGIVGRAIAIDCHYGAAYQNHVKYWCRGWSRRCTVIAKTNWQNGRFSITDDKTQRIFVVTMKDLRSGDTGWYSCGIEQSNLDTMFSVKLQISEESVSVPVLKFLSPPNVSHSGGSVSVSCESVRGSLPIQYTWTERTPSEESNIADTNKLDLRCRSFKQQQQQYYCTASNTQGKQSSEMVNVIVFNKTEKSCSYVILTETIVSGALWAKPTVTGILGRAIAIDCHYGAGYQNHVKYWCHGWSRQCTVIAKTNWQNGRFSITDDKTQRIFVVTMKDLRSGDTGWYSCGIEQSNLDQMFHVKLQISEESVSVPVLRFLSLPKVSCSGGSVSVSCEPARGSLPIQYTWTEKTPSEESKISDTNKLDLRCQSFKQQQQQYYCTASNTRGKQSSEMVNVKVFNKTEKSCSYVTQISSIGPKYSCEVSSTESPASTHSMSRSSTSKQSESSDSKNAESLIYIVLGVLAAILIVFVVSLLLYLKINNKGSIGTLCHRRDKTLRDDQQLAAEEENIVYADVNRLNRNSARTQREGTVQLTNDEITYAAVQFQKKSSRRSNEMSRHSAYNMDGAIYSNITIQSQPPKENPKSPQESEMSTYANDAL